VTYLQHRHMCPYDYPGYRSESEFDSHGHRDLVDPHLDVDKQLLDEVVAHCLTGARPRRRAALATACILTTLILTVWLTMPVQHVSDPRSFTQPASIRD